MNRNLIYLYLVETCSGMARGSFLVCIGWTTLVVVGDVAAVGQVFIVAMLTTMLAGPLSAVIVDRHNRKHLVIVAHLGIALSMIALGTAVAQLGDLSRAWFFLAVATAVALRNLYMGAHDGLLHANVEHTQLVTAVSRFRGIHLAATAIGTVAAGVIIEWYSPTAGFVFSAVASILLALFAGGLTGAVEHSVSTGLRGFLSDLRAGLELFRRYRELPSLVLLAAVALPIGQLSNAILSSFIRDDLGRGSDVFGIVDAAWPLGGMAAAALLGLGLRQRKSNGLEYLFALLVGLSTLLFAYCDSVPMLVLVHAAMGFTVWICRILIDGRILQICDADTVGRTRAYIEVTFSFSALLMCLSPTLVNLPTTGDYFFYWGAIVVICTLLLWVARCRVRPGSG